MAAAGEPKVLNLVDILSTSIREVQELRVSVGQVFEELSNGMKQTDGSEIKEKKFLADFKQRFLTVVKHFSDLEKLANTIPPNVSTPGLGNTSLLTLDSIVDKTPTYHHLLQAYKWSSKAHDHATVALSVFNSHSLKRSQTSSLHAKRARKIQGTCHAVPPHMVDTVVQKMEQSFPDMKFTLTRPMGSPAVLQITLGMTFKAIVVLRGLVIEWVSVKGMDEDFCGENGKPDVWSRSKHQVFQKVTDHTHAAMLHFYHPTLIPDLAVKSFMRWLYSYNTLFSAPCQRCGKHLRDNLPPTWRNTLNVEAYHEMCRP